MSEVAPKQRSNGDQARGSAVGAVADPEERIDLLLRDLRSARSGLSSREVERRLVQVGENVLVRRGGRRWPRELIRQLTHPLALLLWMASALSFAVGNEAVAIAVLLVIVLNAAFAFVQELQAERASRPRAQPEALARRRTPR